MRSMLHLLSFDPRRFRGRLLPSLLVTAAFLGFGVPAGGQITDPAPDPVPADPGGVVIDSIQVVGNHHVAEAALLGSIGIPIGEPIGYREIQVAEKRLWETGWFEDIQVTVRGGAGQPIVLTFRLVEHPVVRSVDIVGLQTMSSREVWEEVELPTGEPYSPHRVFVAQQVIRDGLAEKGVPFAQVEVRQEPLEGVTGEINLILEVQEGHRVAVAEVVFRGNEEFADSDLRSVMSTRPEGFLWFRSGTFNDDVLQEDLSERLPEFYASQGFLDFAVLGDTLIVDPSSGKARLEVDVLEGEQYRLADFSIEGNRRFATQDLERYYQTEEGGLLRSLGLRSSANADGRQPVFDRAAFMQATQRIGELYRNEGYLYAQVSPEIERLPDESDNGAPVVAARWTIQEGQPAYVRRIRIEGNEFTHDRVIRERISILPGDVYSEERLLRSYQGISGLGFFETPLPFPEIQPDEQTGDVDIVFRVEEQRTGSINFGSSMGGATGVSGFIGYDQPNLFGQAKSGSLRWDFGRYQNNFSLSYTDPSLFQSRVSGSISLFDSRDRFFSFATGERKLRGVSTRFGVPVPGSLYSRVFVGYSLSRTDYRLRGGADDASLFGRPAGVQSQVSAGITRRTIDHPLFPTVGSEQSWTSEFNGGIFGGDGNFSKHTVQGKWWVPVGSIGGTEPGSRPMRIALGLGTRGGAIFGDAENFPFESFWLGGVQFGERLRGYEETTLTPAGYFSRGSGQITDIERLGNTFFSTTAELAFRLSDMISLSAFYEAGNVWRHPREIDPSRMFRGAGIGVELVTPFGPLGLDYAYGFDKDVPGWQLHFRMGGNQQF